MASRGLLSRFTPCLRVRSQSWSLKSWQAAFPASQVAGGEASHQRVIRRQSAPQIQAMAITAGMYNVEVLPLSNGSRIIRNKDAGHAGWIHFIQALLYVPVSVAVDRQCDSQEDEQRVTQPSTGFIVTFFTSMV